LSRALIHHLQKLVCRILGHKVNVISKDVLWECQRCRATFLAKGFLKGSDEAQHAFSPTPEENGQAPSVINNRKKRDKR
jgi:hypothetical protein